MSHSRLHEPDLIATSIGLHGRVISSAEVDITPAGGLAFQGGTQLGGVSYVVCFLGITTELPENTRVRKDMTLGGRSFKKKRSCDHSDKHAGVVRLGSHLFLSRKI
jgi:hypothetical protein